MSRYRGPRLRISRRLSSRKSRVILPGLTKKISNKINQPGKKGGPDTDTNKKLNEYSIRLEEKQKLKFNYGVTESQLYKYVKKARRKVGSTGIVLLQLLEMRLDTICFILGFGKSILQTRQFVNHCHIDVNKELVSIPSLNCKLKDIISIKEKNTSKTLIENNNNKFKNLPNHLTFDNITFEGNINDFSNRYDIQLEINELLVIEYYSRR